MRKYFLFLFLAAAISGMADEDERDERFKQFIKPLNNFADIIWGNDKKEMPPLEPTTDSQEVKKRFAEIETELFGTNYSTNSAGLLTRFQRIDETLHFTWNATRTKPSQDQEQTRPQPDK